MRVHDPLHLGDGFRHFVANALELLGIAAIVDLHLFPDRGGDLAGHFVGHAVPGRRLAGGRFGRSIGSGIGHLLGGLGRASGQAQGAQGTSSHTIVHLSLETASSMISGVVPFSSTALLPAHKLPIQWNFAPV